MVMVGRNRTGNRIGRGFFWSCYVGTEVDMRRMGRRTM